MTNLWPQHSLRCTCFNQSWLIACYSYRRVASRCGELDRKYLLDFITPRYILSILNVQATSLKASIKANAKALARAFDPGEPKPAPPNHSLTMGVDAASEVTVRAPLYRNFVFSYRHDFHLKIPHRGGIPDNTRQLKKS